MNLGLTWAKLSKQDRIGESFNFEKYGSNVVSLIELIQYINFCSSLNLKWLGYGLNNNIIASNNISVRLAGCLLLFRVN